MSDRTAMSRRPSIQKAQEAIHRLPSEAASGRTLSSNISRKMEVTQLIGDYIRGVAEMVCKQEERRSIFFEVLAGSDHNQKDRGGAHRIAVSRAGHMHS